MDCDLYSSYIRIYIYYVQVETLYTLQLVQKACTSCNLYKQFVQVATRTKLAGTEFHLQINPTCTILLYKLDLKKNFVDNTSHFIYINIQINVRVSHIYNFYIKINTEFT